MAELQLVCPPPTRKNLLHELTRLPSGLALASPPTHTATGDTRGRFDAQRYAQKYKDQKRSPFPPPPPLPPQTSKGRKGGYTHGERMGRAEHVARTVLDEAAADGGGVGAAAAMIGRGDEPGPVEAECARILKCPLGAPPLDVLGLRPCLRPGVDAVRKRFRQLAMRLHPDKCDLPGSTEAFKRVNAAFRQLDGGRSPDR